MTRRPRELGQWVGVGLAVAVLVAWLVGVGELLAEADGLGVGLLDGVGEGWLAVGEG
jgi:hypothetical protein